LGPAGKGAGQCGEASVREETVEKGEPEGGERVEGGMRMGRGRKEERIW